MNTKLFASALVAAVGFAAAPSFAADYVGEVGYVPPAPVASTSTLTRAAVHDAVLQAKREGTLVDTGEGADLAAATTGSSQLTRQAVRAQAVYAVRHGLTIGGEV